MFTILSISKIFALILGLVVITKSYLDYRKKEESLQVFLVWAALWIAIIVFAFSPALIIELSSRLGDKKITFGQIGIMGFVFILFITYRVYIKAHRLEKKINKLVQKLALKDIKKIK